MKDFSDNPFYLVLRESSLLHPESELSVQPREQFFEAYFFVSCFPTMALNRTKLKYGTMKQKAYEKIRRMTEFGAIYLLGLKVLEYSESALLSVP